MDALVELTDEQGEKLRELARAGGTSVRELISRAVDDLIRRSRSEAGRTCRRLTPEQRERALSVSGKYDSGLGDVAENHDKYLAEDFAR